MRATSCIVSIAISFAALLPAGAQVLNINGNHVGWGSGTWNMSMMSINGGGSFTMSGDNTKVDNRGGYYVGDQSAGSFWQSGGLALGSLLSVSRNGNFSISGGIFQVSDYIAVGGYATSATLTVTGGTMRAKNLSTSGNSTVRIYQSAGGMEISTDVWLSAGIYSLTGGQLSAPLVQINNGGEMLVAGGTVTTGAFLRPNTYGPSTITMGGGRIVATTSTTSFISNVFNLQLIDGGTTVIDTNGKTIGIESSIKRHDSLATVDCGLIIAGGGTLTLTGHNPYYGQTQLQGATTLRLSGANSLLNSTLNITSGTVQFLNQTSSTLGGLAGNQNLRLANDTGAALTLDVGRNHENTTYSGVLSGSGALVKSGTGSLTLSGVNAYTGGTVVNSGTLVLQNNPNQGYGTVRGDITVNNAVLLANSVNAFGWNDNLKVNSVLINSGTFLSTGMGDQGWGVAYTLNNAYLASNGGVNSATTASNFAFGGLPGAGTSVTANSGTSTIAGRVNLRGDHGNLNTNFTVAPDASLLISAVITSGSGNTGLSKLGGGTMILTGSNSYSGGTIVSGGTITAGNSRALGSGRVLVVGGVLLVDEGTSLANAITLSGGAYQRRLSGSLANAVDSTSDLGGVDTRARLLAGTVTGTTTLTTSFSSTSSATNDEFRFSDVYHLEGTGTDLFVLELSFASTDENAFVGWLDGDHWTDAVAGNTGNNATGGMLDFQGSFAEFQSIYGTNLALYVGAYGVDVQGGTTSVWAVLNHNSAFAAVPEPGTGTLLALCAFAFAARRRRATTARGS